MRSSPKVLEEAYCDTSGRRTESTSLSSGVRASRVLQCKLEVHSNTNSRCVADRRQMIEAVPDPDEAEITDLLAKNLLGA